MHATATLLPSPMYEVRIAGAKGLGVFARKLIPRGTRIFSERPLLSINHNQDSSDIYAAAKLLATKDRADFMKLSFHTTKELEISRWSQAVWYTAVSILKTGARVLKGGKNLVAPSKGSNSIRDHVEVLSIFRSNAFALGRNEQMIRQAVFLGISRINHSCLPNAQGNFHDGMGRFNVHATRDIKVDEEVSINYLPEDGELREARTSKLSNGYGFDCACPACDLEVLRGRQGEEKRLAMKLLVKEFATKAMNSGTRDLESELKTMMAFIELYESEGIAGRELSELYMRAVDINMDMKNFRDALKLAVMALQLDQDCVGKDHKDYHKSLLIVNQLKTLV